jgi:hypothetical protein
VSAPLTGPESRRRGNADVRASRVAYSPGAEHFGYSYDGLGASVFLTETEPGRYFFTVVNEASNLVVTVSDKKLPWDAIQTFMDEYGRMPK